MKKVLGSLASAFWPWPARTSCWRKMSPPGRSVWKPGKIKEAEASSDIEEPNFGYEGHLGCFVATTNGNARCMIAIHAYPDNMKVSLGSTKLTYEGARKLGNVNGYVFKTEFDGQKYPSRIFLNAEKVYFGGGINNYIAADYRSGTGWAWKYVPLRP